MRGCSLLLLLFLSSVPVQAFFRRGWGAVEPPLATPLPPELIGGSTPAASSEGAHSQPEGSSVLPQADALSHRVLQDNFTPSASPRASPDPLGFCGPSTSPGGGYYAFLTGDLGSINVTTLLDDFGNPFNATIAATARGLSAFARVYGNARVTAQEGTHAAAPVVGNGTFFFGPTSGDSLVLAPFQLTSLTACYSLWFRTAVGGGALMAFDTTASSQGSSNTDRVLYMSSDGSLVFGLHDTYAGKVIVKSEPGYADGDWHHAAACYDYDGSDGLQTLYVDGHFKGSSDRVIDHAYTNPSAMHLHIGYEPLSSGGIGGSWPYSGSGQFIGQMDNIVVFSFMLTEGQVAALAANLIPCLGSSNSPASAAPSSSPSPSSMVREGQRVEGGRGGGSWLCCD